MDGSTREEKGNIWWAEPPAECLPFDFCRDTSLHGLKYIYQPQRHLSERIFWLISFIIGLGLAVYLISGVWQNYRNKPIIVAFEPFETTVDDVPFPAITVCNMNKVLRSKAETILANLQRYESEEKTREHLQMAFQLEHICSVSAGFSKSFNFSLSQGAVEDARLKHVNYTDVKDQLNIEHFLQKNSQKCPDMLPLCIWKDEIQNCTQLFNPIETDFGKCCTFNMVSQSLLHKFKNDTRDNETEVEQWKLWDVEKDGLLISDEMEENNNTRVLPRRQRRAGKSFGLSILLDPNLAEYFCTTSDSVGFRLAAHLPLDVPHVADFGIGVAPNSEVFVNIRPEITMADEAIKGFPLDKRRCYFAKEYPLKYYNYYTTSNCIDECIADETQKDCDCVRYYMPQPENATLCGPTKFECAEMVKSNLERYILQGLKNRCNNCLRTCTEIQYYMETTSTPLLYDDSNWQYPNDTFASWRHNNASIVHIFIGQPSTYARVRKQLYGGTDLMANTGGLMGLCLGFSGLSLVEVIYYFTLRAWWRRKRGVTIFNTVLDVWTKTKEFTTGAYGKSQMVNPNHQIDMPVGQVNVNMTGRNERTNFGVRNSADIAREFNSTFLMNGQSPYNSQSGQAMFHEIAPYYNNPENRRPPTQYWRL